MATIGLGSCVWLTTPYVGISTTPTSSTYRLDGATKKYAFKYFPQSTSPITDIDLRLDVNGTVTGMNFIVQVESDSGDAPSGMVLGATNNAKSAAWAGLSADGWTGLKSLAENTGNLTVHIPVWIVVLYSSGSIPDASNYIAPYGVTNAIMPWGISRMRHFNGTDWTTDAATAGYTDHIVKHADGSYVGSPHTTTLPISSPSVSTIYGTTKQGVRIKSGSQIQVVGMKVRIAKTGSLADLVVTVYEGNVSKYSETIPATSITTAVWMPIWFTSPQLLAADTNINIVFSQNGGGGSSGNDYDMFVTTFSSTYAGTVKAPDVGFIYGTNTSPDGWTPASGEYPITMIPLISDLAANLDQATSSGGGGLPVVGGSLVR